MKEGAVNAVTRTGDDETRKKSRGARNGKTVWGRKLNGRRRGEDEGAMQDHRKGDARNAGLYNTRTGLPERKECRHSMTARSEDGRPASQEDTKKEEGNEPSKKYRRTK
jgi:hypothetical protein